MRTLPLEGGQLALATSVACIGYLAPVDLYWVRVLSKAGICDLRRRWRHLPQLHFPKQHMHI